MSLAAATLEANTDEDEMIEKLTRDLEKMTSEHEMLSLRISRMSNRENQTDDERASVYCLLQTERRLRAIIRFTRNKRDAMLE